MPEHHASYTDVLSKFLDYTSSFSSSQEDAAQSKLSHTIGTVNTAVDIALNHSLDFNDIAECAFIALFHDIGRFPQWEIYHTYVDSRSEQHADIGIRVLFEDGLIQKFLPNITPQQPSYQEIFTAVKFHSSRYVDYSAMSPRERLFTQLIRDADKLDNCRSRLSTPMDVIMHKIGLSIEDMPSSIISQIVFDTFMNSETVNLSDCKTPADFFLAGMAIFFDLVFPYSFSVISDNNWVSTSFDRFCVSDPHHFRDEHTLDQLKQAESLLTKFTTS